MPATPPPCAPPHPQPEPAPAVVPPLFTDAEPAQQEDAAQGGVADAMHPLRDMLPDQTPEELALLRVAEHLPEMIRDVDAQRHADLTAAAASVVETALRGLQAPDNEPALAALPRTAGLLALPAPDMPAAAE